jgi:hypothetical protein
MEEEQALEDDSYEEKENEDEDDNGERYIVRA